MLKYLNQIIAILYLRDSEWEDPRRTASVYSPWSK
jgi:hypothetical protein